MDLLRLCAELRALGYLGGGILLVINVVWILAPEMFGIASTTLASRLAMLSVAVWWALFSVPIFRTVGEPPRRVADADELDLNPVRAGFTRLSRFRQYGISSSSSPKWCPSSRL